MPDPVIVQVLEVLTLNESLGCLHRLSKINLLCTGILTCAEQSKQGNIAQHESSVYSGL